MAGPWVIPLLAVSAAVSAMGAISQAKAAQQAADYNAQVAANNAEMSRMQASQAEDAKRRDTRQFLGTQRAAFAEAGGGFGGSALDVMRQSSVTAELDALMMRYNGDLRAQGFDATSAQETFAGQRAMQAGYVSAAGSVLSAASSYGAMKGNMDLTNALKANTAAMNGNGGPSNIDVYAGKPY